MHMLRNTHFATLKLFFLFFIFSDFIFSAFGDSELNKNHRGGDVSDTAQNFF